MLTEYVKLSITSIDNTWTSRTVYALIAPGLCMPIILRLPFLIHNNIVTDHAAPVYATLIYENPGLAMINPHRVFPTTQKKGVKGVMLWCWGWLELLMMSFR